MHDPDSWLGLDLYDHDGDRLGTVVAEDSRHVTLDTGAVVDTGRVHRVRHMYDDEARLTLSPTWVGTRDDLADLLRPMDPALEVEGCECRLPTLGVVVAMESDDLMVSVDAEDGYLTWRAGPDLVDTVCRVHRAVGVLRG